MLPDLVALRKPGQAQAMGQDLGDEGFVRLSYTRLSAQSGFAYLKGSIDRTTLLRAVSWTEN